MSASRPAPYAQQHANPQGEGDARPTAMQIVKDEQLVGKLTGKVALITGCSSGIGVETARAIHATGADTYITARDVAKAQAVVDDIRKSNPDSASKLEVIKMELDKLSSVREGAAAFLQRSGGKLNILVNNAGVMACPYTKTADGIEQQFGVCHVAHFLLFQLVKGALLSSASAAFPSRVVSVSSCGHRSGSVLLDDYNFSDGAKYHEWIGYGQAKTANIWLANEIERRYGAQHLHATSLHPGGIWTPLQRHLSKDSMSAWNEPKWAAKFKSTQQGAATSVWAAIGAEWANKGGVFLEDCAQALPVEDGKDADFYYDGYSKHAYDAEGAKQLWTLSAKLTGTAE